MRTQNQKRLDRQKRLGTYLDGVSHAVGHIDRVVPMRNYIKGLLLPIERKSVEPMAARLAPDNVGPMHQSLHHIVAEASWSDATMLAAVRSKVLPVLTRRHRLAAWIVKDSVSPKRGEHSVGVARQPYDSTGKLANCRVAVSVSMATAEASLSVAYRLYLPKIWVDNQERRQAAGVPEKIASQTIPEIALDQIRQMVKENVPCAPVVADAAYGDDSRFRERLEAMGLQYCVEIKSSTSVWLPIPAASPPEIKRKVGRPPKITHREERRPPLSARELALCLSKTDLHRVSWQEGASDVKHSHFARLRVRAASYYESAQNEQASGGWLLVEWPTTERGPTKYWLSNLPESISLQQLVTTAKMYWRVEHDYKELQEEIGLNHYEGRNWRGFHHHATLCIAAYGFLVLERYAASLAVK